MLLAVGIVILPLQLGFNLRQLFFQLPFFVRVLLPLNPLLKFFPFFLQLFDFAVYLIGVYGTGFRLFAALLGCGFVRFLRAVWRFIGFPGQLRRIGFRRGYGFRRVKGDARRSVRFRYNPVNANRLVQRFVGRDVFVILRRTRLLRAVGFR